MKIVIICGSNRSNSESSRVARFLKTRIEVLTDLDSEIIDLHQLPFSVSPDDHSPGKQDENFKKISEKIDGCDGMIIISPEWGGMAPPMLKALLIFINKPAAFKPALLVGVSAGRGGAFPISELKASGNKNNFITFLPEHLLFRDIGNMLKDNLPENKEDQYIRERSDYAIKLLAEFTKAHLAIRNSGVIDLKKYAYGMS